MCYTPFVKDLIGIFPLSYLLVSALHLGEPFFASPFGGGVAAASRDGEGVGANIVRPHFQRCEIKKRADNIRPYDGFVAFIFNLNS